MRPAGAGSRWATLPVSRHGRAGRRYDSEDSEDSEAAPTPLLLVNWLGNPRVFSRRHELGAAAGGGGESGLRRRAAAARPGSARPGTDPGPSHAVTVSSVRGGAVTLRLPPGLCVCRRVSDWH